MLGLRLVQQVDHVLEVLDVAALIGRDRDALRVLLDGAAHDLRDGAVVAEVDDLGAGRLHDPTHHVDGGVVTIEQRRRGDDADVVARLVRRGGGELVHGRRLALPRAPAGRDGAWGRLTPFLARQLSKYL